MSNFSLTTEGAAVALAKELDRYEWLYDVVAESKTVITVYCHYLNKDVFNMVPEKFGGFSVKLGFEGYLNCAEKYAKVIELNDLGF